MFPATTGLADWLIANDRLAAETGIAVGVFGAAGVFVGSGSGLPPPLSLVGTGVGVSVGKGGGRVGEG